MPLLHRQLALATTLGVTAALLAPWAAPAQAQTTAQSSVVSADPAGFTPNVLDGKVEAFAQVGNLIVAGGSFSRVQASGGGTTYTRNNIVAFNATTGAISTSFAPNVSGEVYDIEPAGDGASVYVVGSFTQVAGSASSRVARLDVSTGAKVAGFTVPTINGTVKNVDLVGGRLLLGGGFTSVGGSPRTSLASLNPTTGALTAFLDLAVSGTNNGGGTQVLKMAVSPDASRLVAIGNFTSMGGQQRLQIAMVDLTGGAATLADWSTGLYTDSCNPVFDTYMRDLDFSPDGSYFVVSTTGAYGGPDAPCDVITRWESAATGTNLEPTWRDYTGGDTTYAVAVTGAAVYVGGHMRWLNNPEAGDAPGPGAVPREGIAALDPVNGLPLSWNPGRARGVGVFDMLATSTGLWVGSDTDRIGGETHRKIAFFPLAGGTTPPTQALGHLPGDVYLLGGASGAADPGVLYRVNTGGGEIQSVDDGPDWLSDQDAVDAGWRSGNVNAAGYGPVQTVDASVPNASYDRAPAALFSTEAWGGDAGAEMGWHFPVPAGQQVTVRMYFANRYDGTSQAGQRVFDVSLDGSTVLPDLDPAGHYGDQVGAMESFAITSDGTVDIGFVHQVENPLIDGIEIVTTGSQVPTGAGLTAADAASRRSFDGSTPGPTTAVSSTVGWGSSRGAFLVDANLYAAFSDGTLTKRQFNGTSFGAASTVNLYGGSFASDIPNLTGLTYSGGRVYYTLFGDDTVHWRWFSPQSDVVGETRFDVGGDDSDLQPSRVHGMFLSGTDLYVADRASGDLLHMRLSGTTLTGPLTTADSSAEWTARSLFLRSGSTPVNQPPTAHAAANCPATGLTCSFSSAGSSDPEGGALTYLWDFGDGGTSTAANPTHGYASAGTRTVTLTVRDPQTLSGTDSVQAITADAQPVAGFTTSCTALACIFTDASSGSITSRSWSFGDGATSTQTSPSHTYSGPGTYPVTLTVTGPGGTDSETVSVTVPPATSPVGFRGQNTATGAGQQLAVPAVPGAQSSDVLLLFVTSAKGSQPAAAPTGWTLVGTQADGTDTRTTLYRRVGTAGGLGTVTWTVSTKTQLTVLAYSGAAAVPTASVSAAKTTASSTNFVAPAATVAADGSVVVAFWAIRASSSATWTTPAGTTERTDSAGTGSGQVGAASADQLNVDAGPTGARTATSTVASAKGLGWTVVLGPA